MDVLDRLIHEMRDEWRLKQRKKAGPNICGIDDFIEDVQLEEKRLVREQSELQSLPILEREKASNTLRFELMSLPGLRQVIRQKRGVRNWFWRKIINQEMFDLASSELVDQFVTDQGLQLHGQEVLVKLLLRLRRQLRRLT